MLKNRLQLLNVVIGLLRYSHLWLYCIPIVAAVNAEESVKEDKKSRLVKPGKSDNVSASLLAGGKVALENEYLKFVFDPEDAGAASSILFKPAKRELAVCLTYGQRHFKAFRESLSVQRMKEGRISPSGQPYELMRLYVKDETALATFTGHPFVPPKNSTGQKASMGKVRIVKTYSLRSGSTELEVEIRAVNESNERLPLALWILSGHRVEGENIDCFARSIRGTVTRPDSWVKGASSFLVVPRPAAPWTGAVGAGPEKTGMFIVADEGKVDLIYNWLAKFAGYTFGLGTPQQQLDPGGALSLRYSFFATVGLPRIDAAAGKMACGIELPSSIQPGREFSATITSVSASSQEITSSMRMRKLPDGESRLIGKAAFQLAPGKGSSQKLTMTATAEGTYVVTAILTSSVGQKLVAERAFTVGESADRYRASRPKLDGTPFWSLSSERPQPAWMRQCDRSVKHPMIPWNQPAAGKAARVLFIGNPGYTTGIFRDLGRRAGVEWEFVNLSRTGGASYTTGDRADEPYRGSEQVAIAKRLRESPPDCVLTAGIQYENVEPSFIRSLLAAINKGLGLVVVGPPGSAYSGPWPAFLKQPGFNRIEGDFMGPMSSLFRSGIAPPPLGTIERYRYGKGQLIFLTKKFVFSRGSYSRNDLLPQIRGRTRLPDWEYHFAQYVKAIRSVSGPAPTVRIRDIRLNSKSIQVDYTSDRSREASLAWDVIPLGSLEAAKGIRNVSLGEGRGSVSLTTSQTWPAGEHVIHVWILDGKCEPQDERSPADSWLLRRENHPLPVLNFSARFFVLESHVKIETIHLDGEAQPVPETVIVNLKAAEDGVAKRLSVVAEIRNGSDARVAWRSRKDWITEQTNTVSFDNIHYVPVAPESIVSIQVKNGDEVLCTKAQRFRSKVNGDVAEEEMIFTTTTGTQADWYVTQVMKDWAIVEAGLERRLYEYGTLLDGIFGVGSASFPWRRMPDDVLNPPIVDEAVLRQGLSDVLRDGFEKRGTTYFCLQDEFHLGGEYDWSPGTLAAFRKHVKKSYSKIKNLNAEWETDFDSFDAVMPRRLKEVKTQTDNLAPWLDFRLFMDSRVNRRYEIANEEAAKISHLIRVGESGMYPPAFDVGVNYYTVAQASRFMMTYSGLRADWTRAFLSDDSVAGTWFGYGSQHPRHPWEAMFKGYSILAWWGYLPKGLPHMAMIRPDLVPNRRFPEIGRHQIEIQKGIGRLFVQSRPSPPRVFIPYSQSSIYTANALDRDYMAATQVAVRLLAKLSLPYSFIADEQATRGKSKRLKKSLILFPAAESLPAVAARTYANVLRRRCFALADAFTATRDGHGKVLPAGSLDRAFGIRRSNSRVMERPIIAPIEWTDRAPESLRSIKGQMVQAFKKIEASTGVVWANFPDGTPAVVGNSTSRDSLALWLNTSLSPSKTQRPQSTSKDSKDLLSPNQTIEQVTRFLIQKAGIVSPVRVDPPELRPTLVSEFEKGRTRIYGLLLGGNRGSVKVLLPAKAHTYETRSGKYMGEVDTFDDSFDPSQHARVYVQLPYQVAGISAALDAEIKRRGEVIRLSGRIEAKGGATESHVLHCELVDPGGARPYYHRKNASAPKGRFELEWPLALNAPPGIWTLELRDAASGVTRSLTFEVR